MSKLPLKVDRSQLPSHWHWCDWSGRADAQSFYAKDEAIRLKFLQRFMAFVATGGRLPKEQGYFAKQGGGAGVAKIMKPNPGYRCWFYREGTEYYITHFVKKNSKDDGVKENVAQVGIAKSEKPKKPNK